MVLAHEMARVAIRDPLKAVSQGAMLQILRSAIFGEQVANWTWRMMLSMLSYSHLQETAADEAAWIGVRTLWFYQWCGRDV